MIERVISGFQTGADIGGIMAARQLLLPTGGWMPKGYLTEDGPRPEYATLYGAQEHSSPLYPPRTEANARDSDATIWFGRGDSRGFGCTMNACRKAGKPVLTIVTRSITPHKTALWLKRFQVKTLNVAGNRESSSPGISRKVESYLAGMFLIMMGDDEYAYEGTQPPC